MSGASCLIELVFRNGLSLGGIEVGGSAEVVGTGFQGRVVAFRLAGARVEFGLGRRRR